MENSFIVIQNGDSVGVALHDLKKDTILQTPEGSVKLLDDISRGHKFALKDINDGENIIKYGFPIGHATKPIKKGAWVHTHNVKTNLDGELSYTYEPIKTQNTSTKD